MIYNKIFEILNKLIHKVTKAKKLFNLAIYNLLIKLN